MNEKHSGDIRRINRLTNELESLYHQASLKLGVADSVSIVMYALHEAGNECLLSDIYKESGISKQTINSSHSISGSRRDSLSGAAYRQSKESCFDGKRQGVCDANRSETLSGRDECL